MKNTLYYFYTIFTDFEIYIFKIVLSLKEKNNFFFYFALLLTSFYCSSIFTFSSIFALALKVKLFLNTL